MVYIKWYSAVIIVSYRSLNIKVVKCIRGYEQFLTNARSNATDSVCLTKPGNYVVNLLQQALSFDVCEVLSKGLNFALTPFSLHVSLL